MSSIIELFNSIDNDSNLSTDEIQLIMNEPLSCIGISHVFQNNNNLKMAIKDIPFHPFFNITENKKINIMFSLKELMIYTQGAVSHDADIRKKWFEYENSRTSHNLAGNLLYHCYNFYNGMYINHEDLECIFENNPNSLINMGTFYIISCMNIRNMAGITKINIGMKLYWREVARCFNYLVDIGYPIDLSVLQGGDASMFVIVLLAAIDNLEFDKFVMNFLRFHPEKTNKKLLYDFIGQYISNIKEYNESNYITGEDLIANELLPFQRVLKMLTSCDTGIENHYQEIIFDLFTNPNIDISDNDHRLEYGTWKYLAEQGLKLGFHIPDAIIDRINGAGIAISEITAGLKMNVVLMVIAKYVDVIRLISINKYDGYENMIDNMIKNLKRHINHQYDHDVLTKYVNSQVLYVARYGFNYDKFKDYIIQSGQDNIEKAIYMFISAYHALIHAKNSVFISPLDKLIVDYRTPIKDKYWPEFLGNICTDNLSTRSTMEQYTEYFNMFIGIPLDIPFDAQYGDLAKKLNYVCHNPNKWKNGRIYIINYYKNIIELVYKYKKNSLVECNDSIKILAFKNLTSNVIITKIIEFLVW